MKLNSLRGKTRTIYVEVEGEEEKVRVDYAPGNLTFDLGEKIQDGVNAGNLTEAAGMLNLLETILVDWDLEEDILDEEGNPTGETRKLTTREADLKKVPIPFLGLVFQEIQGDSRPNALSSSSSSDTSPQTEEQDPSQNGISSFGLQKGTESHLGNS